MKLTTSLNRDQYFWVVNDPAPADDAHLTISVDACGYEGPALLRVQVGSAMQSAQIRGGPHGRAGAILDVDLGEFGPDESRRFKVRVTPGRQSRPGRRRVAVVQVVDAGVVLASTTVWARVECQPPSADNTSAPPTRRM
jgi:hypothetical protein